MENCIFCKIVAKEIPAHIVYEDSDFVAFLDTNPVSVGHTLIVPKIHHRWVWDVPNIGAYFEVTRVEMFRNLGIYYKELEDSGILLPVVNYSIRFFKPAYYDDEIVVKAAVKNPPMASIRFNYETVNAKGEIINCADTTLAFIDKKSEKPMRAPAYVIEKFCL